MITMAHKAKKASKKAVRKVVADSIKENRNLLKKLEKEDRVMLTEYDSSVNTGFRGSWDFTVDSSLSGDSQFVTDRVAEPFAVNVYVNPISTQRKARKLRTFGE